MADESTDTAAGPRFRGVMTLEGVETSDGRIIGANECTWRELPLSLMAMTKASHGGMPTTETSYAGAIDLIERQPGPEAGTFQLYFEGVFDTGEVGTETARLVGSDPQMLRGVSIDFAADEEVEVTEEDEDGWPTAYLVHYSNVEIGMATVCPFPAFAGGYLELVDAAAVDTSEPAVDEAAALLDLDAARALPGLVASACVPCGSTRAGALVAAGGPVDPPAAWFEAPDVDGPTPLTISDTGRIFGHLATWNECHVGISGQCVTPPRSATNYSRFRVAHVITAEGTRVPTAALFMGTPHASTRDRLGIDAVQAHYADTGSATADVAAGEDRYGIWIAGALRPDLTPAQVRAIRGSVLSGDWRSHAGHLELVAALHVNVPGYAVPHAELVASAGEPVALVAAGAMAMQAVSTERRQLEAVDVESAVERAVARSLAPLLEPARQARREAAAARVAAVAPAPVPAPLSPEVRGRRAAALVRVTAALRGSR